MKKDAVFSTVPDDAVERQRHGSPGRGRGHIRPGG